MNDSILEKLKDIKPPVEITDYSLYFFILIVIAMAILIILSIYFIYKKIPKKQKVHFNLDNSKETAYKLIELIREKEGSEKYIEKLHQYTYKKEVPPFDKELFNEIKEKFKL